MFGYHWDFQFSSHYVQADCWVTIILFVFLIIFNENNKNTLSMWVPICLLSKWAEPDVLKSFHTCTHKQSSCPCSLLSCCSSSHKAAETDPVSLGNERWSAMFDPIIVINWTGQREKTEGLHKRERERGKMKHKTYTCGFVPSWFDMHVL